MINFILSFFYYTFELRITSNYYFMKNLYTSFFALSALLLASCSTGSNGDSDAAILGINGKVKSINQRIYKIESMDGTTENRVADNGDCDKHLSMGDSSNEAVHNFVHNRVESGKLPAEECNNLRPLYPDPYIGCNFNFAFNESGDLTTCEFIKYDGSTIRTESTYRKDGSLSEKKTYNTGEIDEDFGSIGRLTILSSYDEKEQMIDKISYGAYINRYTQKVETESVYEYSKETRKYDNKGREIALSIYFEEVLSSVAISKYEGNNATVETKEYDEKGEVVDYNVSTYELDENGEIIEKEPVCYALDESDSSITTNYDEQNNWIEKRSDYIYEDGTVEYRLVVVREIQYY